jgi:hypothetical protein
VTVEIETVVAGGAPRRGKLNIVDLAGSERLGMSGCGDDPKSLAETQAINLSLTSLGALSLLLLLLLLQFVVLRSSLNSRCCR